MPREMLVGGSSASKRRRRASRGEAQGPMLVGPRFVAAVGLLAVAFAGIGYWRVDTVFSIRDHEIETNRLQEIALERHNRQKVYRSRISNLQRGEILRRVAEGNLGMRVPEPTEMDRVLVPRETAERWKAAAEESKEKEEL